GCARSPVENGFDWVLMRLLAGIKVTRAELTGMGVGGLLMEIVTRPQPRTAPETEGNRNVAALAPAAAPRAQSGGQSHRRGDRARRRPLDADGRPQQAARGDRRQEAGADRRR